MIELCEEKLLGLKVDDLFIYLSDQMVKECLNKYSINELLG
jgi:hypothetical protein